MNTIDSQLKLKEKFDRLVPSTMEGNTIYLKYAKIFEDEKFPVTQFTKFINESLVSKDPFLKKWATENQKTIMESCMNLWNFTLLLEKYQMSESPIYGNVIDKLRYLTTYDPKMFEHCVRNGALNEFVGFQDIKNMNTHLNNIFYAKHLNESNIKFHPLSYFEVKNGDVVFMLENKAYRYNKKHGLQETQMPSQTFVDVNNAINEMPYNVDTDEYDMTYLVGNVNVTNKGKIYLDKEPIGLQDLQSKVIESIKNLPYKDALVETRKFDTLSLVVNNWHKMVRFDNVSGIKNTVNESCIYLMDHENGMKYIIDKTGIIKETDSISEALKEIKEYMNVDLSESFVEDLHKEQMTNRKIRNIDSLIEAEIEKYDSKISEVKEEMVFMMEGSEKWKEAEHIIKLCEDGKEALKLNKKVNS